MSSFVFHLGIPGCSAHIGCSFANTTSSNLQREGICVGDAKRPSRSWKLSRRFSLVNAAPSRPRFHIEASDSDSDPKEQRHRLPRSFPRAEAVAKDLANFLFEALDDRAVETAESKVQRRNERAEAVIGCSWATLVPETEDPATESSLGSPDGFKLMPPIFDVLPADIRQRAVVRAVMFATLPPILAASVFPMYFYVLPSYFNTQVDPVVPIISAALILLLQPLSIMYGFFSTSWEPTIPQSLIGVREYLLNYHLLEANLQQLLLWKRPDLYDDDL